jgi:exopolysaccharide biosynthesis polyprenyl glycosylphosphotransferase
MIGRRQEINLKFNQLIDLALIAIAFWLSYHVRAWFPEWLFFSGEAVKPISNFYWQVCILAPFTPLVLEQFGYYRNPLLKDPWPFITIGQMIKALLIMGFCMAIGVVFFKQAADSRAILVVHAVISGIFLLTKEGLIRHRMQRAVSERHQERVVVAGQPEDCARLLEALDPSVLRSMLVVARINIETQPTSDLVEALHLHSVERVLLAASHVHFDKIQSAINACELEGVEAWLWTDFVKTAIARPSFDSLGGRPMLVFRTTPEVSWQLVFKGLIDFIAGIIIIIATSPLWLAAYLGIKLQSPGPAIFRQQRSGKNGRPFTMYKFRSMRTDAEQLRNSLEGQNEMTGPVFKITHDPRIFPFGQFIRKYSIDELPQLLNVVRGEMSLVGPRPLPVYEVERIEEDAQRRRLSVKPGLTCLWQVSGRNDITDFKDWVALDLQYIDTWSLGLDIAILFKTVPAVLFRSGAK